MAAFVYRFRYLIVAVFCLLTLGAAFFIPNLHFDGDIQALAPSHVFSVEEFRHVNELFGGADSLAVSVPSRALFTPEALAEAAAINKELQGLPDVSDVVSVFTYVEPANVEDGLSFIPYVDPDALPSDQASVEALKSRLQGLKTVSGKLLSGDGDTLLYVLQISPNVSQIRLVDGIKGIIAAHPDFAFEMAGTPFIDYQMVNYMRQDVVVLVVFGLLAVILVLLVGF